MAADVALAVRGVTAGYGRIPIVRGVDFEVAEREIVALVGRNGVGKTTLIKAIMGLIRPKAGVVAFHGTDVTGLDASQRARRGMGYVPQGRGIFARLSVEENLRMGETVGRNGTFNYERVFDIFPVLEERRRQKGGSLSGGQQQMLAIGRVLVGNPRLLLLDEPSEGIQPSFVHDFAEIVRRLRDSTGLTVLLVEQNWDLISRVADRCEVMEKGEIVARLSAEDMTDTEKATKFLLI